MTCVSPRSLNSPGGHRERVREYFTRYYYYYFFFFLARFRFSLVQYAHVGIQYACMGFNYLLNAARTTTYTHIHTYNILYTRMLQSTLAVY